MRYLIIHSGGFGDILLLSPSLRALRESVGNELEINLLVENRAYEPSLEYFSLYETPVINKVLCFDFKGERKGLNLIKKAFELLKILRGYDVIVSSGSSPLIALLLKLSGAKITIGYKSPTSFLLSHSVKLNKELYASEMLFELFKPLIKQADLPRVELVPDSRGLKNLGDLNVTGEKKYILLHPGVSKLSVRKNIIKTPSLAYWQKLISKLLKDFGEEYKIILIAGEDERQACSEISEKFRSESSFIDLSQKNLSIRELLGVIKQSAAFICADSAPMHLGVSLKIPLVCIFGGTDPKKLLPKDKLFKAVKADNIFCSPCLWNRRNTSCSLPLCIELQNPEAVINSISSLIK